MLAQRSRRWANIKPTLDQRLGFAGLLCMRSYYHSRKLDAYQNKPMSLPASCHSQCIPGPHHQVYCIHHSLTLNLCCFKVGPSSQTADQSWNTIRSKSHCSHTRLHDFCWFLNLNQFKFQHVDKHYISVMWPYWKVHWKILHSLKVKPFWHVVNVIISKPINFVSEFHCIWYQIV